MEGALMRTDETLRLRLAGIDTATDYADWLRLKCAETRANVEYARAQVAEERAALPTIEEVSGLLKKPKDEDFSIREYMAHLRGTTRE